MGIITTDSEAAHIGRLRRLAEQTKPKGMSASVRGDEIRTVLAALDRERAARIAAETELSERPAKKGGRAPARSFDDEDVRALLAVCNDIVQHKPELIMQPLPVAVKAWCAGDGSDMPQPWERLLTGLP